MDKLQSMSYRKQEIFPLKFSKKNIRGIFCIVFLEMCFLVLGKPESLNDKFPGNRIRMTKFQVTELRLVIILLLTCYIT